METPFKIGDVMFLPHLHPTEMSVKCHLCEGHRTVLLLCRSGEQVEVACKACERGYVREYSYEPRVLPFEILAVESMSLGLDGKAHWYLRSRREDVAEFGSLCWSHEAALEASRETLEKLLENNKRSHYARTGHQREHVTWTVAHHEKCIKDLERQLAYHRDRVSERRKKI